MALTRGFALRNTARYVTLPAATFHTSASRWALSEADRDSPDRDQKIEHHKQDSVNKAKSGQGEWKPELSSASEQAVAGEKSNLSMDEMQKLGEKQAQQGKTPSGSSSSGKH